MLIKFQPSFSTMVDGLAANLCHRLFRVGLSLDFRINRNFWGGFIRFWRRSCLIFVVVTIGRKFQSCVAAKLIISIMFYNLNSYVFKGSTTMFEQSQKTMSPRWGSGNVLHVSSYKDITPLGFQGCSDISRFFFTKSI